MAQILITVKNQPIEKEKFDNLINAALPLIRVSALSNMDLIAIAAHLLEKDVAATINNQLYSSIVQ